MLAMNKIYFQKFRKSPKQHSKLLDTLFMKWVFALFFSQLMLKTVQIPSGFGNSHIF